MTFDPTKNSLEVGLTKSRDRVVVVHPDIDADKDGVGHIVFTPTQGRSFAHLVLLKCDEIDPPAAPLPITVVGSKRCQPERIGGAWSHCDEPPEDLRPLVSLSVRELAAMLGLGSVRAFGLAAQANLVQENELRERMATLFAKVKGLSEAGIQEYSIANFESEMATIAKRVRAESSNAKLFIAIAVVPGETPPGGDKSSN